MPQSVIIAGAGHSAGQLVVTLRQQHFDGDILMIGEEAWFPYQRPPLSKRFLAGELPAERLYVKPATFYDEAGVDVRLNTRITAIVPRDHRLETAAGESFRYDKLVLAVGARVRRMDIDGAGLGGVHYLRSIDDVERIRADVDSAHKVVVVGAGYIGLEVAAVIRELGRAVTVLEVADRVMSRVVSPVVSGFYQQQHATHGVEILLATGIEAIVGEDRVIAVETTDGRRIPADVVIIGVGIVPNTELAAAAGLGVDNGILVDDRCRTQDGDIYAVGDCTAHPNPVYGRRVRLESVHNALEQAKTAAANICGKDIGYSEVPWFWSDQYDLKLQIAGLSQGYDDVVVRGRPDDAPFSCVYMCDGRVIACDAINAPRDFMQSKQLIAEHRAPDRRKLADAGIQLKDIA